MLHKGSVQLGAMCLSSSKLFHHLQCFMALTCAVAIPGCYTSCDVWTAFLSSLLLNGGGVVSVAFLLVHAQMKRGHRGGLSIALGVLVLMITVDDVFFAKYCFATMPILNSDL